jgi:hypothetical protein
MEYMSTLLLSIEASILLQLLVMEGLDEYIPLNMKAKVAL